MISLEEIVDRTFRDSYRYKLDDVHIEYITKPLSSLLRQDQIPFQDQEFLNYLAKPTQFDSEKIVTLFYVSDLLFQNKKYRHKSSLFTLLPSLFLEKIRYPFVYSLSQEDKEAIREKYQQFATLTKVLAWDLSRSESKMAGEDLASGLLITCKINFSLNSLKHSQEALKHEFEKGIDYYGCLGSYLLYLAEIIYGFENFNKGNSLTDSLTEELKSDLRDIPQDLGLYTQVLQHLKEDSLSKTYLFCLEQAREYHREFFNKWEAGERPEKPEHTCSVNRAMLAKTSLHLALAAPGNERNAFFKEAEENFAEALKAPLEKRYDVEQLGKLRYYAILSKLKKEKCQTP